MGLLTAPPHSFKPFRPGKDRNTIIAVHCNMNWESFEAAPDATVAALFPALSAAEATGGANTNEPEIPATRHLYVDGPLPGGLQFSWIRLEVQSTPTCTCFRPPRNCARFRPQASDMLLGEQDHDGYALRCENPVVCPRDILNADFVCWPREGDTIRAAPVSGADILLEAFAFRPHFNTHCIICCCVFCVASVRNASVCAYVQHTQRCTPKSSCCLALFKT